MLKISSKDTFAPLSAANDIVERELENELLIYNLKTNKAFCLNKTSAFVWRNANGKRSVNEISDELSKVYKEKVDNEFVWFALNELAKENLIKNLPEEGVPGMNRREVIKRIGLGTAIALPIVTGLIAPQAIHAASTCDTVSGVFVLGSACATSAECTGVTGCSNGSGQPGTCAGGTCCCPAPQ